MNGAVDDVNLGDAEKSGGGGVWPTPDIGAAGDAEVRGARGASGTFCGRWPPLKNKERERKLLLKTLFFSRRASHRLNGRKPEIRDDWALKIMSGETQRVRTAELAYVKT